MRKKTTGFCLTPKHGFIITLLFFLTITAYAVFFLEKNNQLKIESATKYIASHVEEDTINRIQHFQYGLRGARGAILAASESRISRSSFNKYSLSRNILNEFPGAMGFGFIRRVAQTEEKDFIQAARQDGAPNFSVRQLQAHDGERYIIQYIEPEKKNSSAIGLDIASESNRRAAAEKSLSSGELQLTGPINLVQESDSSKFSFLLLIPIYQSGTTPNNKIERQKNGIGWSYAALTMSDILSHLPYSSKEVGLKFEDITDKNNPVTFFNNIQKNVLPVAPGITRIKNFYGRDWRISTEFYSPVINKIELARLSIVASCGVLLSFFLGWCVFFWMRRRQFDRQVVNARAQLAAIVESSKDAIIGKSLDGTITSWNKGAENLFGYTASEAIGKRVSDLIVPPECGEEEHDILRRIAMGKAISSFNTKRLTKDRNYIQVSLAISPIYNNNGNVIGAAKTVRDNTEQYAAEAKIHELNQNLEQQVLARKNELLSVQSLQRAILSDAAHAIIATDSDGVITVFNPAAEKLLGYSSAEVVGKITPAVFHDVNEVIARAEALSKELLETVQPGFDVFVVKSLRNLPNECEWTYLRKDGHRVPVLLSVSALKSDDGSLFGYLGMAVDLSERKSSELILSDLYDKLSARSKDLERMGQIAGIGAWSIDLTKMAVFWSPQTYRIHEVAEGIVPTFETALEFYPPEARAKLDNAIQKAIDELGSWDIEVPFLTANKRPLWVRAVGEVECNHEGEAVRLVGGFQDITDKHKASVELEVMRDQLLLAAEVAKLGIWRWELSDNSLQWNDQMFEFYDQPLTLKIGGVNFDHWRNRVHFEDVDATVASLMAAVDGRGVYDPIFRVIATNGNIRHIQAAAYIERNDDGKALRVIGINLDVTDHVLLESHLRQAKEQADSASRAKTEFLANMSHEIRTPMNAILGMLQLLQQTGLDIKQGDYASKAESAAKALLGIINDILDFSRVEAGKMVLDPQPFRIDKLLSDIAVIITTNIGSKNIEVLFEVDPTIPEWVVGDDLRIQQVLINLAGNAIKFTERGEVVLSVKLSSTDEDGVWLAFAVRDTGIGLTPEQSQSIFGGFEQAEASTSRRFGGTGLGLAISQRFVHMLGGTLQVKSRLGEGCTFYFTIKCKYVRDLQVDPSEPSVIAMKDLYCLVVDDNESARVVLSNMLTSFGWKIHTADSGATALDALRRRPQNQPYDVIFIDWRMPGMDGWETVELIKKEMPKDNATIIIMVTAHSRELLSQRQAEMPTLLDGFLVKPVTSSMLYEAVAKSISGKQLPALKSVSTKVRPKRLVGVRILLVEDNSINQQVASELLQNEGANVVIAANGREGIDAVQDALTQFDIVLMDVQMPDMDGYIATKEIRKTHPQSALPIVAMTANVMATDRDAALSAGMNDHIGKPFELSQLVSTILRYTKPEQEFDDANAVIALPQRLELLNTSAAIARMAGNVEIYIRALSSFPGGMEELASKLAQALEMSDTNAVSRALHAIKGVASTIGAEQLSNLVSMIEDALHCNSVVLSTCPWSDFWRVVDETKVAVETFLTIVAIEQEDGAHVPTALNVSALCDDLKKLHRLLSSANMAADEVFEQLKKEYNFAAFPEFLLLESSISSLDFSNASVHCEILLKRVSEDIDE